MKKSIILNAPITWDRTCFPYSSESNIEKNIRVRVNLARIMPMNSMFCRLLILLCSMNSKFRKK